MIQRILLVVVLIGGALLYTLYAQKNLEGTVQVKEDQEFLLSTLPDVQFTTLDGAKRKVRDLASDEQVDLVLVHYWATWCGPCEAELSDLMKFIQNWQGNAAFVLVAVNDELPKMKKFIKSIATPKKKILWLRDDNNVHRANFGTTKLPETYVFSKEHKMLRKFVGPQEWAKPMFLEIFDQFPQ